MVSQLLLFFTAWPVRNDDGDDDVWFEICIIIHVVSSKMISYEMVFLSKMILYGTWYNTVYTEACDYYVCLHF